jgi:hypothetical protein
MFECSLPQLEVSRVGRHTRSMRSGAKNRNSERATRPLPPPAYFACTAQKRTWRHRATASRPTSNKSRPTRRHSLSPLRRGPAHPRRFHVAPQIGGRQRPAPAINTRADGLADEPRRARPPAVSQEQPHREARRAGVGHDRGASIGRRRWSCSMASWSASARARPCTRSVSASAMSIPADPPPPHRFEGRTEAATSRSTSSWTFVTHVPFATSHFPRKKAGYDVSVAADRHGLHGVRRRDWARNFDDVDPAVACGDPPPVDGRAGVRARPARDVARVVAVHRGPWPRA